MASGGVTDNVVYGALMFFSDSKKNKSKKKSNFVSKPVKFYQTAQLHETCDIQQEDHILHIQTSDKLTIFLRCNNVFIVHRNRDGAVAVLKNARFQQSNPPVTLDGSKYSVFMEGAGMTLMYAVALESCKEGSGIKVNTNDVVLILAITKGNHFVAITPCLKVVILPTAMLRVLTYPRRLLREGMTLKMKSMDGKLIQELFKATEDLFTWRTKYGEMVPLHSFEREVDFDVSNVLRDAPPLPPPRLPPTETSQVQEENTSRGEHWFKGRISRGKAEELLKDEGDYLFRFKGHDSNTIVLSHCIGNEEFRHVIVLEEKESSCEEIRYEGTTAIHQRILDFAKSAGLPFQDDEPIRLGGASVKAVNPYATYSDIIARNDDKLFKPRQGARNGDTEDTYADIYEPNLPSTMIVQKEQRQVDPEPRSFQATPLIETSSSVDYSGYEVVVAPENCKCTEESKEIDSLYNYMKETFDANTLEALRFLREYGHILVDALVKVELNEISMLLEDLCETVRLCDSPHDQE
ncbi:uncharacterized protein [Apostichopus japonicus]|uniref:uncharacterized protein isoform X2 n=1 Tax=Stichopus japonicus TaxID=307972 RepID=UPI003AB91927